MSDQVCLLNPLNKKTGDDHRSLALAPCSWDFQKDRLVSFLDNEGVLSRIVSGKGSGQIDR